MKNLVLRQIYLLVHTQISNYVCTDSSLQKLTELEEKKTHTTHKIT